jgi:hypothetical protein
MYQIIGKIDLSGLYFGVGSIMAFSLEVSNCPVLPFSY